MIACGQERARVLLLWTSAPACTSTWEVMYHVPEHAEEILVTNVRRTVAPNPGRELIGR